MLYEKSYLMQTFKENSEGMTESKFIGEKASEILDLFLEHDNGKRFYRYFGPYWEKMYQLFLKYCSEKLDKYENIAGPFEAFNEEIESKFDYGSEILNFMAALQYYDVRTSGRHLPEEPHILEIDGQEIPYLPNQYIDKTYLGRE